MYAHVSCLKSGAQIDMKVGAEVEYEMRVTAGVPRVTQQLKCKPRNPEVQVDVLASLKNICFGVLKYIRGVIHKAGRL